ncbi:hypothetical protein AVEN_185690-1, partial [Araneus ventricosus]
RRPIPASNSAEDELFFYILKFSTGYVFKRLRCREELMFVTGHGPFPSYLHRFNLRTHDNCLRGEKGDPIVTKSPNNNDDLGLQVEFNTFFNQRQPSEGVGGLAGTKSPNNNDDLGLQVGFKRSSTSVNRRGELGFTYAVER